MPAFFALATASFGVFTHFIIAVASGESPFTSPFDTLLRNLRSLKGLVVLLDATSVCAKFPQGIFDSADFNFCAVIPRPFASSQISRGLPSGIAAQNAGFDSPAIHSPIPAPSCHCATPASPFPIQGASAAPASCAVRFTPDKSSRSFKASPR